MPDAPLFQKVDAVTVPVPDLPSGLDFYCSRLGHELLWRNEEIGQAGLRLPDSDTEIVLCESQPAKPAPNYAPSWLVASVANALEVIRSAGGRVIREPFDIPVGRVAVVADPFENVLVILDLSKGRYATDASGAVTGIVSESSQSWESSSLPRAIVRTLDAPKSPAEIADELQVTDARVLWYLTRLAEESRVEENDGRWSRTDSATEYLSRPGQVTDDVTVLPGRTVYDYQQAFADADAGMFGPTFVRQGGEHGSRMSYEQVQEFNERLQALIGEYFGPGKGDRQGTKYGLHWVLTPTDLHPLDG